MNSTRLAFLIAVALSTGCTSAQVESDIHAAALKADDALTYAQTHPEAMQAAYDALDEVGGHSATIAQAVNQAKGTLESNPAAAHAALAAVAAVTVTKQPGNP